MKKFTFALMALLALAFSVKAQQLVSTEPANRNVIIEEFTARGCGYCPIAHRVTHEIMTANPGRVWSVFIHSTGNLSPTSSPNLNTTVSGTYSAAFPHDGTPSGVFNRNTSSASGINESGSIWVNYVNQYLNQPAECNVAGKVAINPDTRLATITVEVYYTGNSSVSENYLTVVMLQDSILGAQSDYGNYNPGGWLNGQYVHMHALRDVITPTWGEAISPTTQGTLITKVYEYPIPETIGSPNGVNVNLNHVSFLAWVSERYQGTPTRPILNACELDRSLLTDEPIYPSLGQITQAVGASCSQTQSFSFSLSNIGTEELTSVRFNAVVGDVTKAFEWTGSLLSGDKTRIDFDMNLPFGSFDGTLQVVEANGTAYESQKPFAAESLEWATVSVNTDVTSLKVIVVQDQWGEQITWDIINSAGDVVAEEGPYSHLIGSGSTQPNVKNVENLPVNDCYLFRIYDGNNNGICCNYGNGYYQIKDANNNLIVDGDGAFGSEAKHLISIVNPNAVSVVTSDPRILGDHEAMFIGSVNASVDEVGFEYSKLVSSEVVTVVGEVNGDVFTARVDGLESSTMYSVKAYATVSGQKIYGNEIHFETWVEGVSEFGNSLRVYPNPANNYLTVEGDITSVAVYNTVGQCLMSKQVDGNTQIDLSGFNNGIYFLRVYNNEEMAIRKFSVNR